MCIVLKRRVVVLKRFLVVRWKMTVKDEIKTLVLVDQCHEYKLCPMIMLARAVLDETKVSIDYYKCIQEKCQWYNSVCKEK